MSDGAPVPEGAAPASRRQWLGFGGFTGGLIAIGLIVVGGLFFVVFKSCACQTPSTPALPASPVDGVVVSVDAASLGQVNGFSLRTSNGVTYVLRLGSLENATEFSPSHLAEHQATSAPIRVWYLLDGGQPVVYRVEDAPD